MIGTTRDRGNSRTDRADVDGRATRCGLVAEAELHELVAAFGGCANESVRA